LIIGGDNWGRRRSDGRCDGQLRVSRNCRAPAHFLSRYWRTGNLGAFRMGLRLGAYCVGCCWILMGLLFVGGVMNLLWIAAIAIFVLLEKTVPFGDVSGRFAGAAMILVGALSWAL
jgi:predicted metal-binding membrane protein